MLTTALPGCPPPPAGNATVGNPNTAARERVSALVDTGSTFAMLPADTLHRPGIAPTRTRRRRLADGQVAEYQTGTAYLEIEVDGIDGEAMAVFGPEGVYLPGATTLDALPFVLDPINRRLVSDCGLLMRGCIAAGRPAAGQSGIGMGITAS